MNPRVFANREFVIGLIFGFLLNFMVFGYAGLIPPIFTKPYGLSCYCHRIINGRTWSRHYVRVINVRSHASAVFSKTNRSYRHRLHCRFDLVVILFTPNVNAVTICLVLFMQGAGFGYLSVSLTTVAFQSMSPSLRADGTSVLSLFRRLGSSIGVSVLVTQLARSSQEARQILGENYSQHNELFQHLCYPINGTWRLFAVFYQWKK